MAVLLLSMVHSLSLASTKYQLKYNPVNRSFSFVPPPPPPEHVSLHSKSLCQNMARASGKWE